ncbi:Hypothetical protein, putative [Bodo saltans]|uniref:Uncharacterized protein n=1 Tax=Bodo saltans TaxID=75058 RepID=A0A0S4JIP6_BODSA|nr:Hypothetical protein, putative [Bodo saltans]|eukprot:CUG91324.1 Hypothetical protein, putative [Bodo saltans]
MSMDEWNIDFVIDDDVDMFKSAPALREMQDDLEQFVRRQADLTPYKTPPRSDLQPPTPTNGVDDDTTVSEILHERTVRALSPLRSLEEAAPPAAAKTTTTTTLVPLSHSSKSSPAPVVTFVVAAAPTAGRQQQQQVVEDADARRKRIVDELLSARRRASGVISVSQQHASAAVVLAPQPTQQGHTVGDNITPSFSAMQTRPPSTHLSPVSVIVTHHDEQSGGQYSAFSSSLPDGPLALFGNGGSPSQDIVNSRGVSPEQQQQQQQQRVVVVTPPPSAVLKSTSTATTSTVIVSAPTSNTTAAPVTPRQTAAAAVQGGAALPNVSLVVLKEESFEDGTTTQRFYSRGRLTTPRAPDDVRGNRADMVAILLKTAHHIQLQAEDELTGALRQQASEHPQYLVFQPSQQPLRARRVLTPPPEALLPSNEATVVVSSLPRGDAPAASSFISPSQFPRYISADNTPDKVRSPYPINELFTSSASSGGVAGPSTTYGGQQQPSTTSSGINVRGGMTTSTTTPPHSSRVHSASPHPQNPYSTPVTLLSSPQQQQQPQYHPLVVLHQQQQHPLAPIADGNWIPPRAKGRVATLGPDIRRAATLPEKRFDVAVGTASYAAAELMDQVKRTTQHLYKDPAAAVSNVPPPPPPTTLPLRAIASMHFPQRPPPTDVPLVSKNVAVSSHERALLHGGDQPAPRPSTNTAIRSPQQQQHQQQHQQQRPVVHVAPPPPPVRAPLALSSQPAAPPQQPHRSPTYEALQVPEPYTPTSDNSPSRSMAALRRSRSVTFL